MNRQKTLYHLVVDKSGSMSSCSKQTIEGFNAQIARIRSLSVEFPDQEVSVGLTLFDTEVECLYTTKAAEHCPDLNAKTYEPGGSTALLDAIGMTIQRLEKAKAEAEMTQPATVVMVIITDGHENASRMHNFKEVSDRIAALQETGQWTFTYLGATLDAAQVGESLKIDQRNNRFFRKEAIGREVFDEVSDSMRQYMLKKRKGEDLNDFYGKTNNDQTQP